jgi:uncharacterized protein (TIRG00374 family)
VTAAPPGNRAELARDPADFAGLLWYLLITAVGVAPTPGGVGEVEAVLLAALTGAGMAAATALAAVFLYRLVTYWVPIPIGALTMRRLTGQGLL